MAYVLLALQWASTLAVVGIGIVAARNWLRVREPSRGFLALALGSLAVVEILGVIPRVGLLAYPKQVLSLALFMLVGYAFVLFRSVYSPISRSWLIGIGVGAAAVCVFYLTVGPAPASNASGAATTRFDPLQYSALVALFVYWSLMIGEPMLRLVLASRNRPAVQRARMRSLALGFGLIIGILLVAIALVRAPGGSNQAVTVAIDAVVLLIAWPLVYVSFAPPGFVRRLWREREEENFRLATEELLAFSRDRQELSERALHWALRLVGGDGGMLADPTGKVLAAEGLQEAEISELSHIASETGSRSLVVRGRGLAMVIPVRIHQRQGSLAMMSGAFTPLFGDEEIVRLNQYAAMVSTAFDRVRLTEQMNQRTLELAELNRQLEEATRLKSEFLANMSHELRTPMSAILGFSQVLLEGGDGELNDLQREDVQLIEQSGQQLLDLINDILDLSKIEAGRMDLDVTDVAISELATSVAHAMEPLAAVKKISLNVDAADAGALARGDEKRTRQVLTNLLSNAIKFTETGGVTVRVAGDEGQVLLEVIDTGIGIPPEAAAIIFEDFRQVRSVAAGRPSGTGLGLAISRRLVQMQGGSIGFESEPGKGSRFWFTIPRARARGGAATAPQPHVSEGVATAESDGHVDARTAAAASTPRAEGAPPQLEDLRRALGSATEPAEHLVLVIDDDVSVRRLIVRRLNEAGFRTAEAEDAEAGLEMARSLQPDAITLDLVMPRLDGWSALRRLKSDPATAAIPVVILTILDEGEAALEIGASAYVHKPFSGPALAAVVDNGDLARTLQRAIDESGVRRASSPIG